MKVIFLDFETYYDDLYSLRKMTPVEYILDQRFEAIGCGIKEGLDGAPFWLDGPDLPDYFRRLPPDCGLVSHNALFDACITAWRYGFVPRMTTCTMSTARALLRYKLEGVSLDRVSKHLGIGVKGSTVHKMKGMNLAAIKAIPSFYREVTEYGIDDVSKCASIFSKLIQGKDYNGPTLPVEELAVMDMVIRCAIQPRFILDSYVLAEHLQAVLAEKEALLQRVTASKDELMSNDKFAELLRSLGVDPPMKVSKATGNETYAFAKTDVEFLDLLEHENPQVQALMAARFGYKSTIEETRAKRFIAISQLQWADGNAYMPMPIRYGGAHTHRLSGDWDLNVQNLRRGGKLRKSLKVQQGKRALTVDAAQIEARLTGWFCGCDKLTGQFARKEDVYANFASTAFGFKVNKVDHPTERFCGKQAILGLGFGLGWLNFKRRLATDSENQTGTRISLDDDQARTLVNTYRSEFREIPETWKILNYRMIPRLAATGAPMEWGPLVIVDNAIILPSLTGEIGKGLRLHYHGLEYKDNEWWFTYGGKRKKLYGGKILENIVQALDRVIVMGAALRIQMRIQPYRLAQQAHDENAYIVNEEHVDAVKAILLEEMTRRPPWAPDLPLAAEAGVGISYGDAK